MHAPAIDLIGDQCRAPIILVHGAFVHASSWSGVVPALQHQGHHVIAWANPLRGVADDAADLTDLVRALDRPTVLVGHSYGGAVNTNAAPDAGAPMALVYVARFALAPGESCADAAALASGSTLGYTLEPVQLSGGDTDTYIAQEKYYHQFSADLPPADAAIMAVTQRPVTEAALREPSGDTPLWQRLLSWFL